MPHFITDGQGTNDWISARVGCLTASRMAAALSFLKSGKESEERAKLKKALVAERMTGLATENYVNDAMRFGLENEPWVRERFEEQEGILVQSCGFALHDEIEYLGCSPDGMIGDDGLVEFKVPQSITYAGWLIEGVVPEQHKPQLLCQLAVMKRKYVLFCAGDPRVRRGPQLFIRRYEPTQEEIVSLEKSAVQFLKEVDDLFDKVTRQEATNV